MQDRGAGSLEAVLFFDDHPLESENKLFLSLLRDELPAERVRVLHEKTIRRLERRLSVTFCRVVILDIMSEVPANFRPLHNETTGRVDPMLAGVEILRRIRAGFYGREYERSLVFMRSARGEPHIISLCAKVGASGHFQAGSQDFALIAQLKELFAK